MAQHSDTPALRTAFIDRFMWMHDEIDVHAVTMEDILDLWDMELGAAKVRYGAHFSADGQYHEGTEWLAERDYRVES